MSLFFGLITPSQAESLLSKAVVFASVASIGGIFVLVGLLLEKGKEKHLFSDVNDFRLQKTKAEWGSWILIVGIVIEIGTGAALTWIEVGENIDAANRMAQLDPIKRPVSDISAIVDFRVKADKPLETPNWGMPTVAGIFLCESNWCVNTNIPGFFAGTQLQPLVADKFDRYFDGTTLEYVLQFHIEGMGAILNQRFSSTKKVEWAMEYARFMVITTKFLPHDAEILGGSAVLTINSGPQKQFVIQPQKDLDPNSGKYGYGYQVICSTPIATNIVTTPNKP